MIFGELDTGSFEPKPTALYAATASASIANSWTSINGWAVPRVFTSVDEEYESLTTSAAVVDFGALCRYVVRGSAGSDFLARVTTAPLKTLDSGESARGLILAGNGAVADVIEVSRLGADMMLLTTTRPHARRLQLAARGLDAVVEDITGRVAALAIIGPDAREAAAAAGVDVASEHLAAQTTVRGVETAARPINVGAAPGVEVIYPYEEALTLWERVRRAAKPTPVGLTALETLRIESGAPRPGVDFVCADDAPSAEAAFTPDALGLPHLAPVNRAWFNGRRALLESPRLNPHELAVLKIDADEIADDAIVYAAGAPAGRITSHAYSPRMRRVLAFATLESAQIARSLELDAIGGGARVSANIAQTSESNLAQAFAASLEGATESAR